jgi:hypothetical protein
VRDDDREEGEVEGAVDKEVGVERVVVVLVRYKVDVASQDTANLVRALSLGVSPVNGEYDGEFALEVNGVISVTSSSLQ